MNHVFVFKNYVFEPPYAPHYDAYKGHVFLVNKKKTAEAPANHVFLDCVTDNSVKVDGAVHTNDLEPYQWYYHKGETI